jgi:hypothetical protein
MPILAYCVSLSHHFLDAPPVGVGDATIFEVEDMGLRAWYSEVEEGSFSGAEQVTKAALEFHHFVSAVFREGTVLPFKFPAILDSVDDLRDHLEDKAAWYLKALNRSAGLAQFEARIFSKVKVPAIAESGTEYLEQRKKLRESITEAVTSVAQGLNEFLREHHVKDTQQATRMYLLTDRTRVASFKEAAGKIIVPDGIEIRLSGPWPPTEFLPAAEDEL